MFSPLQRYIINVCYSRKGERINRDSFVEFYCTVHDKPAARVKIVTASLERLIDRGYMVGYGVRTPKKWFIREVRLTPLGRKTWERSQAERQKRLPLK